MAARSGKALYLEAPGLVTATSPAMAAGALRRAFGLMCRRQGLYEQRRSYQQDPSAAFPAIPAGYKIVSLFGFDGDLFACATNGASHRLYRRNGGAWGQVGTFAKALPAEASPGRTGYLRTAELNGNDYQAFADGVYRMTGAADAAPKLAGMRRALAANLTAIGATGGVFQTAGQSAAYRWCLAYQDANGNIVRGPPSGRFIFTATAAQVCQFRGYLARSALYDPAVAGMIYEVYRSQLADPGVTPDDRTQLVWQSLITAADVANGYVEFIDVQPDGLRGRELYTSPGQEGIAQANGRPPPCQDIVEHKNSLLFFNIKSPLYRLELQMLAVPARWPVIQVQANTPVAGQATYTIDVSAAFDFTGIGGAAKLSVKACSNAGNNGDFPIVSTDAIARTVVVSNPGAVTNAAPGVGAEMLTAVIVLTPIEPGLATVTLDASYVENLAAGRWRVSVAGTDAQNVRETAASLCRAVSFQHGGGGGQDIVAIDIAKDDDAPGKLLFEASHKFSIQGSPNGGGTTTSALIFGNKFAPTFPTVDASQDSMPHGVAWSKPLEGEHVPAANTKPLGSRKFPILRAVHLRDSVLIFKEDGLYRAITDGAGTWAFQPIDPTVRLLGRNLVGKLNGEAYALTNRGLLVVNDAGHRIISGQVENIISLIVESADASNVADANLLASELDGTVTIYCRYVPSLGTRTGGAINAILTYCPATRLWTGDVRELGQGSGLDTDLLFPFSFPGCFANVDGVGRRIWRHAVRSDVGDVWREAATSFIDPAELKVVENGMPLPGDRYLLQCVSYAAGVFQFSSRSGVFAPQVGDLVQAIAGFASAYYRVQAVAGSNLTLSLVAGTDIGFAAGSYVALRGLLVDGKTQPFTGDDNYGVKTFRELGVIFGEDATAKGITFTAETDADPTLDTQVSAGFERNLRVSLNKAAANRLQVGFQHGNPGEYLQLEGFALEWEGADLESAS